MRALKLAIARTGSVIEAGNLLNSMATEIQPPNPVPTGTNVPSIFLAGSIDQGVAENWQQSIVDQLSDLNCLILNPRRANWDSDLEQKSQNPVFREQVEWELRGLETASVIAFYFAPGSKAPITLLELGLFARSGKVIACCPEGFWRKGNVDIVCSRFAVETVVNFEQLILALRSKIDTKPSD